MPGRKVLEETSKPLPASLAPPSHPRQVHFQQVTYMPHPPIWPKGGVTNHLK